MLVKSQPCPAVGHTLIPRAAATGATTMAATSSALTQLVPISNLTFICLPPIPFLSSASLSAAPTRPLRRDRPRRVRARRSAAGAEGAPGVDGFYAGAGVDDGGAGG